MKRKELNMKKKNSIDVVIAAAASVFALIAICVLFAPGFYEATRGTGFEVIFGFYSRGTNLLPELLIGFILQCLALILPWISLALKGKAKSGLYIFIAALLIASGVLLLFSKNFYIAHNDSIKVGIELGSGFITSIVFDFLGAAVMAIGAFSGLSSKKVED